MRENRFLKRLQHELPQWVERGLLHAEQQQPILDYIGARTSATRYPVSAFSMLGVLLLGTGVITFFAANWSVMPKLVKLLILFGAMWSAYGLAHYLEPRKNSPLLSQALLLLGVILFGANIMLIAQIYHIDEHYPNGVLLWSLGGLLVAYLLRSQPALLAALALATLWTGMEIFEFEDKLHWPFLLVWVLSAVLIFQRKWRTAWHWALLSFMPWSLFTYLNLAWNAEISLRGASLFLLQIYFLVYLGLMLAGMLMATYDAVREFSAPVQRYAALAALLVFYALTFPGLHDLHPQETYSPRPAAAFWRLTTGILLFGLMGLAIWHRRRVSQLASLTYLVWGRALLAAILALLAVNLFIPNQYSDLAAIGCNLLFFAGLVWLIYSGMAQQDRYLVNTAFVFFAAGMVTRYFDTFWTLLNRSFFFMVGGILLLGGGYLLEKQRRKFTEQILAQRGEGGRP
ncbi:DUF2157 domain-containing protein [candidate division KSB1 bacterium]|nr:DUF2157 domain-containing protein [candidate division KSB1 bacterium]